MHAGKFPLSSRSRNWPTTRTPTVLEYKVVSVLRVIFLLREFYLLEFGVVYLARLGIFAVYYLSHKYGSNVPSFLPKFKLI